MGFDCINHLCAESCGGNSTHIVYVFFMFSWHWSSVGNSNRLIKNTRTCLDYKISIITTGDLAKQAAMVAFGMILIQFVWNIPIFTQNFFANNCLKMGKQKISFYTTFLEKLIKISLDSWCMNLHISPVLYYYGIINLQLAILWLMLFVWILPCQRLLSWPCMIQYIYSMIKIINI